MDAVKTRTLLFFTSFVEDASASNGKSKTELGIRALKGITRDCERKLYEGPDLQYLDYDDFHGLSIDPTLHPFEGKSEQVIAQLAGLLASTQSLGRAIASFPWGMISDVVGRKVVILVGLSFAMVSLLGYGSSTSYLAALLRRFIPSLFIGAPVAIKAALGDVCDQEGQAKAMAVFTLGFGIGNVLGPVLGGTLAYPCKKFHGFPACNEGDFFQHRPYFLPCLAVSCIGLLALLSMTFLLIETHPQVAEAPGGWQANLIRVLFCRPRKLASLESGETLASEESNISNPESEGKDVEMGTLDSGERLSLDNAEKGEANSSASSDQEGLDKSSKKPSNKSYAESDTRQNGKAGEELHKDNQDFRDDDESRALLRGSSLEEDGPGNKRWWKDGNILLALTGAAFMALIFNFQDELAPIFVSAPRKEGGIDMSLEEFTWPISCGGVLLIVYSLTLYPKLIKAVGAGNFARLGLVMAIPGALLMPISSLLSPYALEQACLYGAIMIKSVAKVTGLNSSIIAVNLVAPKQSMGKINGAAMAMQSAGRALGPLLSGAIWALSVTLHVPGQQFIGFVAASLALGATQFIYLFLKLPD